MESIQEILYESQASFFNIRVKRGHASLLKWYSNKNNQRDLKGYTLSIQQILSSMIECFVDEEIIPFMRNSNMTDEEIKEVMRTQFTGRKKVTEEVKDGG